MGEKIKQSTICILLSRCLSSPGPIRSSSIVQNYVPQPWLLCQPSHPCMVPLHATFRSLPGHIRAPLAECPREAFGLLHSGSHTGNVSAPHHEVAEVATCGVGEQAQCILLLAGRTNGEQRRGGGKAGKEHEAAPAQQMDQLLQLAEL